MRKLVVVLVLAAALFVWMRSSRARAPVTDGSYLAYEVGADVALDPLVGPLIVVAFAISRGLDRRGRAR